MQRFTPDRPWPLHDTAGIRALEAAAAAGLPPHALMQRAGLAVARLALALAPHANKVWVACGPGNNGGDGFEAALHLKAWGKDVVVTCTGEADRLPPDAARSRLRAQEAGVPWTTAMPDDADFAIDALLGIGTSRPLAGALLEAVRALNASAAPVLAVDVPTGLAADTGAATEAVTASHTLTLLALKPGLFSAGGRDATGQLWFDDLGVLHGAVAPVAAVVAPPLQRARLHASHKGSHGDVLVIGGAAGMAGAALLAGRAALHGGAGRVFVSLLAPVAWPVDPLQPDLMLRDWHEMDISPMTVACGCGGGDAVRQVLAAVIARAGALVLDADALNAVAQAESLRVALLGRSSPAVFTPHPLEAARLLQSTTSAVQADRYAAARALARRYASVVVLKGSGTVIAEPGGATWVNATGNPRLAIGGTGDVLAGMIAARMAAGESAGEAARGAVYLHGLAADHWPPGETLTASALAAR